MYRLNAVDKTGKVVVLSVSDTASHALSRVRDAFSDHPRAWVTDEYDADVSVAELIQRAEHEKKNA